MSKLGWARRGTAAATVGAVVLAGGGAAWAHECMNESRSAKGDANAAASNGWTLTSDILLMFVIPGEVGLPPLTEAQLAEAQAIIAAEKASGEFDEIYALDRAILDHATAMSGNAKDGFTDKSSDNHAIDHATADLAALAPLVDHVIGIYLTVSS